MTVELPAGIAVRAEEVAKVYHPATLKLHKVPTSVLDKMLGRRSSGDVTGGDDGMDDDMSGDDDDTGIEDILGPAEYDEGITDLVWGIRNASFEIERGSIVAVVGPPQSGKTTLLNLISGWEPPSAGRVIVRGKLWPTTRAVAAFLAPGFTVKQNAVIAAKVGSMPKSEVLGRLDELYELLRVRPAAVMGPTGARTRSLAIATALMAEPDVILLDSPALPVEPAEFRQAALTLLGAARDRGATIFIEQPDTDLANELCTHALWLNGGEIVRLGPKDVVLPAYFEATTEEGATFPRTSWTPDHGLRSFSRVAAVFGASVENEDGEHVDVVGPRDSFVVRLAYEFALVPAFVQSGIALTRDDGLRIWLEQPGRERATQAGVLEVFARITTDSLPPGRYAGHVEALVRRQGTESTIARANLFTLVVTGTEETSELRDDGWIVRQAEWTSREPLPQAGV